MNSPRPRYFLRAFRILIIAFSTHVAIGNYPFGIWRLGALFAVAAFVAWVLRTGWAPICMIAEVYVGMSFQAGPRGGDIASQMIEDAWAMAIGAITGLVFGTIVEELKPGHISTEPGPRASPDPESAGKS